MKELSYEQWRALTPKKAADYITERVFMPDITKKKLLEVLKEERKKSGIDKIIKSHPLMGPLWKQLQKETGPAQPKSHRPRRRRKSVKLYKS